METIQIGLADGTPLLALQGAGVVSPARGAVLHEPEGLDGESVEQVVEAALEGTPAEIEGFLNTLRRELARAGVEAEKPGGAARYVWARARAGGELRGSRILRGQVELLGAGAAQRAGGSQGVRLRLVRRAYWESAFAWLPLSNSAGQRLTGGLTVYNHADSQPGHDNFVTLDAADAAGDLPSPALLDFRGLNTADTGTLYAGQAAGALPLAVLEAETGAPGTGVTGANTASAAASEGYYKSLSWNGSAETTLLQFDLDAAAVGAWGGRALLPLLRLFTANAEAGLWFTWRVTVNYAGLRQAAYNTPGRWLPLGLNHCAGAALFLPPWPLGMGDQPPGIGLELRARANASGAHSLAADCLHLLPLDGWRIYRPLLGSYSALKVTDDPAGATLRAGDWAIQMHQGEGPGLTVLPGQANRYAFLMEKSGGGFGIDAQASVRLGCRARWSGL